MRGSETSKAIHKENKKEIQEQIKTLKKELEKYKIINILNLSPDLNKHKENENLTKNSIENCSFQYKNSIIASEVKLSKPSIATLSKTTLRHCEAKPKQSIKNKDKTQIMDCHDLTASNLAMTENTLKNISNSSSNNTFTPPFEIPPTWAWVRLGDICENYTGDSINATQKEKYFTNIQNGLNYIGTKDINNDRTINYENGVKISDEFISNFKIAKANSSLLCLKGGSAGRKIGFLNQNVCFGDTLCCFESVFINAKFLYFYLQNPYFLDLFNASLVGIIGGVSKEKIKDFLVPLPPLKEQEQITKELERLFSLSKGLRVE